MSIALPEQVYSVEQVGRMILEFREYTRLLHDRVIRKKVVGKAVDELPPLSKAARAILHANDVGPSKLSDIEQLVKRLEKVRASAPTVHITLADIPDEAIRQALVEWFRKKVAPTVLVSFAVRADIGGGMLLQAGSRRYDLSFKTAVLANKARLSEVLSYA